MNTSLQLSGRWIATTLVGLFFLITACQSTREQATTQVEPIINQEILSEEGEHILVGKITREGLAKEAYSYWMDYEHQNYTVDVETLDGIQETINSVEILVFLGTWCSDRRRPPGGTRPTWSP